MSNRIYYGAGLLMGVGWIDLCLAAVSILLFGVEGATSHWLVDSGFTLLFVATVFDILYARSDKKSTKVNGAISHAVESVTAFDFSIIVPVYNRADLLSELLVALDAHMPGWSACGHGEIIVVDDGSTDDTPVVAQALAESLKTEIVVVSQKNGGVAAARNTGFRTCRGKVGVVIDSDCLPKTLWLPALLDAVGDGDTLAFSRVVSERRIRYPEEASPAGAKFAGASFAIGVQTYMSFGGCDPSFNGILRDDTDLVLRALTAGVGVKYADGAVVSHPIRRQTLADIRRQGAAHRFDTLLALRHGSGAEEYLGDVFLGGSIRGHYPLSLTLLALLIMYVVMAFAPTSRFGGGGALAQTCLLTAAVGGCYELFIVMTAIKQRVPVKEWPRYARSVGAYVVSSVRGRMAGMISYRLPLV